MTVIIRIVLVLIGLAVVIAVLAGLYHVGRSVVGLVWTLDRQWIHLFVLLGLGLPFAGLVISSAARSAIGYHHKNLRRAEKIQVYRRFLSTWSDTVLYPETNQSQHALRAAELELIVWSTEGVLRRYEEIREFIADTHESRLSGEIIEDLLKEIRLDVGLTSYYLSPQQLTRMLLARDEESSGPESTDSSGADVRG